MSKTAKFFSLVATGALLSSTAQAELVWEQTTLELHPAVGDEKAVGQFKYQNKGDKTVTIKNVTTSCGCTAASAKPAAGPGEKGEVTATFNIGDRIGNQEKAITVMTDDPAHPKTMLTLKVLIPQLLELQSPIVFWQANEPAKAKTIIAKGGKDVSVKKVDVSSSSPDFTAKVEPGPAAGEFRISVEPKQTNRASASTLTIKPVLANGKSKNLYATARVMPPAPSPVQTSAGASRPVVSSNAVPGASSAPNQSKLDPCTLLTSQEIESVQGQPLKEPKGSSQAGEGLASVQCYFGLPTASNSISLSVFQKSNDPDGRDPREFWNKTFHREGDEENENKGRESEEEEKSAPPEKIDGVGDEAYWFGNRVGGQLYVLKGNSFIRISVGGAGDKNTKIDKSKKLAKMVLQRL